MSEDRRICVLCIASYEKGHAFMEELASHEIDVMLLTVEPLRDAAWPRASLSDFFTMADQLSPAEVLKVVYKIARYTQIDRVVALDEFDLEAAALIREEMRLPGMGQTTTRSFRDKLAMRVRARQAGLRVPSFVRVLNYDTMRRWLDVTPGPWMLKPRTNAGAIGIKRLSEPKEVWQALEELGDRQNEFILEQFVPGRVFHVDSITWNREVVHQATHGYGTPPFEVMHGGGVFTTQTLEFQSIEAQKLRKVDVDLLSALGMVAGATHSEYILGEDGEMYFLETAARVGGAYIADVIEAADGINPWTEWARVEAALAHGEEYSIRLPVRRRYAGSVLCLARQPEPDLSSYTDPEIVTRLHRHHHAGLIVRANTSQQVDLLLSKYRVRFEQDFLATAPVPDRPTA